jgi:lipid-binding SYLF domain-containing protein
MTRVISIITTFVVVCAVGCATAPKSSGEQQALTNQANATLASMTTRDPGLHDLLARSAGYAVFPGIDKAAWGVGGAWGRGVLYEGGVPRGFVQLTQASFGFQGGAQQLSELVVFSSNDALNKLKAGKFELGGNLSAIAITTGAAAAARFANGVAVFQLPKAGLMVEASVAGQRLDYSGT